MKSKNIIRGIVVVFVIRLGFAMFPSFQVDMGAWLAWAHRLATLGPAQFYSDTVWTQYTPGFLYWLWGIGEAGLVQPLAIKIPAILADMLTGYLIWKVVSKTSLVWANGLYLLYVLSPIAIIDGSVWGQIDGILTLAMFGSSYLLLEKRSPIWSFVVAGAAFLLKPQAMAIFPILLVLTWVRFGWKKTVQASLAGAAVVLTGFYPFYPGNPVAGIVDLIQKMGVSYPYTSLFAFNIWAYRGMWVADSTLWMGLSYFSWGTIAMAIMFAVVLLRYRQHLTKGSEGYLLFALACFIFFLFPTRVHERYLFPMFAYLMTYAGIKQQKFLLIIVGIMIVTYLGNLYLPYSYYESAMNPLKNIALEAWITKYIPVYATLHLTVFAVLLWLFPARENAKNSIPVSVRHGKTVKKRRN